MKQLFLVFEDKEFTRMKKAKGKRTWKEVIEQGLKQKTQGGKH